jgi:hypothetical protein
MSGDFMHHPVQFARPDLAEMGDEYVEIARETRLRMIERVADSGALMLGTHFTTRPGGRVKRDGDAYRFIPE